MSRETGCGERSFTRGRIASRAPLGNGTYPGTPFRRSSETVEAGAAPARGVQVRSERALGFRRLFGDVLRHRQRGLFLLVLLLVFLVALGVVAAAPTAVVHLDDLLGEVEILAH